MSRLNLDTSAGGNYNPRYSFMETPVEMHLSPDQRDLRSPPQMPELRESNPAQHIAEESRQRQQSYAPSEKEQQLQNQGIMPDYANCPPPEQHPAHYAPFANASQQLLQSSPVTLPYTNQAYTSQQHVMPMSPTYTHMHEQQPSTQISSQSYAGQPYNSIQEYQQNATRMAPYSYNAHEQQQQGTHTQPQTYQTEPYQISEQQIRDLQMSPQYASYTSPPSSPPPNSPGPLPLKVNPDAPVRSDTMIVGPDTNPLQSPKLPSFPPPTKQATTNAPVEDLSEYHQPGQITHPNQEVRGGGWSNGLCEFSNFGICCLGLICPCILYGRTQHRLTMKSRKEDPTNMLAYETCNGSCTGMGLLCGCQWLMATVQHTRIRKSYGIQGDIASDCVRATCCTCCTLIQDEKEILKREGQRARAARERGATLMSPYTAPGPMMYGTPPK
ncbi:uncharacterized protein N7511_008865 [Penicillium nucicola]|uniref:uncharacterized protein n=1 Tax=Penicillium nucicola TaxID=1850975 RepID=UPI00254589FE|nr:uncharacterized protein N7511_008865 [Penicillium nucicola]KAJ5747169.1 hypothetical protein N7511_008865 [Penicillium nucicola]